MPVTVQVFFSKLAAMNSKYLGGSHYSIIQLMLLSLYYEVLERGTLCLGISKDLIDPFLEKQNDKKTSRVSCFV